MQILKEHKHQPQSNSNGIPYYSIAFGHQIHATLTKGLLQNHVSFLIFGFEADCLLTTV